jgi:hypothetical protein
METWSGELALGFSMNIAAVAFCWISSWRPVPNSIRWHDEDEANEAAGNHDNEPATLWSGGVETTVGLVVAVAVMAAVAMEIVSETEARTFRAARY